MYQFRRQFLILLLSAACQDQNMYQFLRQLFDFTVVSSLSMEVKICTNFLRQMFDLTVISSLSMEVKICTNFLDSYLILLL
jgi:hypothetical protein